MEVDAKQAALSLSQSDGIRETGFKKLGHIEVGTHETVKLG